MDDLISRFFSQRGDRFRLVPAHFLQRLENDVDDMERNERRNPYTVGVVARYFRRAEPEPDFEVKSILIAATPSPIVRLFLHRNGTRLPVTLPPTYANMVTAAAELERDLTGVLTPEAYHAAKFFRAPHKLLAVRSGLCRYGRNNVAYCGDLGSFVRLSVFKTDLPCDDAPWLEPGQMDSCGACRLCINACPGGAIDESHYQIDVNRCLTRYNEYSDIDFPSFIGPSAHNSIVGCMRCQEVCPHNRKLLDFIDEPAEFDEAETAFILDGRPLPEAPPALTDKLKKLGLYDYYEVIPRNLRMLMHL